MGDVRGPQVAHLELEAETRAPQPSLPAPLGARAPGAPAESILTSARLLKRETYRGRPLEAREKAHKTPYLRAGRGEELAICEQTRDL